MSLWKTLGFGRGEESAKTERGQLYTALSGLLENCTESEIKWITGVAGMLGTVANADALLEPAEIERIRQLAQTELHLPEHKARLVVELFERHRIQLLSIEDYQYARLVNEQATRAQRLELLRLLFEVAAADGTITGEEENTILRLAQSLGLGHKDFIEARLAYKARLSVFQP